VRPGARALRQPGWRPPERREHAAHQGECAPGERIELFAGLVRVGEEPGQQPQQRLVSEVEQLGDGCA